MEHGMNCPHHADKDEACTCALTERTMHAAWRKRAEEAETRIAALEAQVKALTAERDAQAEAVRVLGHEVRECFVVFGRMNKEEMMNHLHPKTDANAIARAAVEGGKRED